jgi:predicted GIY-YIG superfamily endonuclease
MLFYVYVLESNKNRHYIGFTSNLPQRLAQHNRKHKGTTYGIDETWRFIITKEFSCKQEAMKTETYLKSLKNYRKAIEYLENMV